MLPPKILAVEPLAAYQLRLRYATGEVKVFDARPYLSGGWFGELRDTGYFKTAHVTPDGGGVEWGHGQDIAPHELYELSATVG
ncbi:MAG: DUF2442 domain-containing protein [Verrucomicrobiales bacterium]|jgi:hypothetical protein|nr:DUF2442 domain-containing protein [Verrucomicrobiales bacterium]MDR1304147.1 DUF2442 domain-containing protein [Verrucomicrobiales bacterium]